MRGKRGKGGKWEEEEGGIGKSRGKEWVRGMGSRGKKRRKEEQGVIGKKKRKNSWRERRSVVSVQLPDPSIPIMVVLKCMY